MKKIANPWWWLAGALTVLPQVAAAAYDPVTGQGNSLDLDPPSTDVSVQFLSTIFGVVDGVLHGTGSQILGTMFGVFNAAVLALGAIVVMYTFIQGTMSTAHEGEVLGKKLNTFWVPIRSAAGIALLLPKASGYCLMQIFVMWVVVQGVGAADSIWSSALGYLERGGVIIHENISPEEKGDARDAFDNFTPKAGKLFQSLVCMYGLQEALNNEVNDRLRQGAVPYFGATLESKLSADGKTKSIRFPGNLDDYPEYRHLEGACGSVVWSQLTESEKKAIKSHTEVDGDLLDEATEARDVAVNQMIVGLSLPAQAVARDMFATDADDRQPLGYWDDGQWRSNVTDKSPLLSGTELKDAVADYMAIMQPTLRALKENVSKRTKFMEDAKKEGWILAGKYFFDLVNVNKNAKAFVDQSKNFIARPPGHLRDLGLHGSHSAQLNCIVNGTPADCAGSIIDINAYLTGAEQYSITYGGGGATSVINSYNPADDPMLHPPQAYSWTQLLKESEPRDRFQAYELQQQRKNSFYGDNVVQIHGFNAEAVENSPYTDGVGGGVVRHGSWFTDMGHKIKHFFSGHGKGTLGGGLSSGLDWLKKLPKEIGGFFEKAYKTVVNFFAGSKESKGPSVSKWWDKFMKSTLKPWLHSGVPSIIKGYKELRDRSTNPIVALATMGNGMVNTGIYAWTGSVVGIMLISVIVTLFPAFNNLWVPVMMALIWIIPIFTMLIGLMLSAGSLLAFYVPMIPYIVFTFGALAWFIGVIEAMVAAPIVALGITHPEGPHDAFGKSEPAVMLLTNVFLRPAMMVFGLIGGIILSYVGLWLLGSGFSYAFGLGDSFYDINKDSGVMAIQYHVLGDKLSPLPMLIAHIAGVVIFVLVAMSIVQRSFSLIYHIPDKVLRWLQGGMQESLGGEIAGQEAQAVQSRFGAGAREAGQAAASGVGKGIEATAGKKGEDDSDKGNKNNDLNVTGNKNTPPPNNNNSNSSNSGSVSGTPGGVPPVPP